MAGSEPSTLCLTAQFLPHSAVPVFFFRNPEQKLNICCSSTLSNKVSSQIGFIQMRAWPLALPLSVVHLVSISLLSFISSMKYTY
ncbi:hypothetical protein Y032_0053g2310 [Ancylostoma ceylanicum]|uniref:Uncharacterized protein n=1 Tax=Ancylostoma ceylanicum TaxID=53326 RepID=A0A016U7I4_9BILA|nr:hypothetical protein Y032_0053g2310 [Ancylostoma ceylanicum]